MKKRRLDAWTVDEAKASARFKQSQKRPYEGRHPIKKLQATPGSAKNERYSERYRK